MVRACDSFFPPDSVSIIRWLDAHIFPSLSLELFQIQEVLDLGLGLVPSVLSRILEVLTLGLGLVPCVFRAVKLVMLRFRL